MNSPLKFLLETWKIIFYEMALKFEEVILLVLILQILSP